MDLALQPEVVAHPVWADPQAEAAAGSKKRKSPTPPPAGILPPSAAAGAAEQGVKRPRTGAAAPADTAAAAAAAEAAAAPAAAQRPAPAVAPAAAGTVTADELRQLLRSKGRILVRAGGVVHFLSWSSNMETETPGKHSAGQLCLRLPTLLAVTRPSHHTHACYSCMHALASPKHTNPAASCRSWPT